MVRITDVVKSNFYSGSTRERYNLRELDVDSRKEERRMTVTEGEVKLNRKRMRNKRRR